MLLKLKRFTHYRFFVFLAFLVMLLFMRYTLQINVSKTILTLFVVIIALSGDRDEIISIAMCCIPLHNAIDLYISLGSCMIAYLLKYVKCIKLNSFSILTFIVVIWELMHCFNSYFSIKLFLASIIPWIFLTIIISLDMKDLDYVFVIRVMASVTAIVCILLLSNLVIKKNYDFTEAFASIHRLGMNFNYAYTQNLLVNPNSLGIVCLLAITAILQISIKENINLIDSILILFLLIFGVLTASRTFLVCFIVMVILLFLGIQINKKKKFQFVVLLGILVILASIILIFWFPNSVEYYIYRFSKDDITNGRDELMRIYNDYISDNMDVMCFGIGLNNFEHKIINVYHISNTVPHNAIQEIIISWGLPGLLMIVFFILIMYMESKRYGEKKILLNFIPLIIILTKSMAGQLLTSGYTMLSLVLAYLSLCQNFKQTEEN